MANNSTDIEQSVKALSPTSPAATQSPDSFASRAENYYEKRPQLISLLHDLHHRYLYLADRYTQALRPRSDEVSDVESPSDAESSLSFDRPPPPATCLAVDLLVAELVVAGVDCEILLAEMSSSERRRAESCRRAELQGSLLEVLEAERMVLLGENARLGYELAAAAEDARALAGEAARTRRNAGELARCVAKMRADHRVCVGAGRRIEELRMQVVGMERREREWGEVMGRREGEKGEVERLRRENKVLGEALAARGRGRWWRAGREEVARLWGRVRKMDWLVGPCGTEVEVG